VITSFAESALPENVIPGAVFKKLTTHVDGRGFFREIIRSTDDFFAEGFGQWSHSVMQQNTVKAWHYHHLQIDWWYAAAGVIHTVLYDNREESPSFGRKIEFLLGEQNDENPQVLCAAIKIPPGVLHGCKVITQTAHLFYITSRTYDPADEGRFAFDSGKVQHDWGNKDELIVSANDRRDFLPHAQRVRSA